MCDSSSFSSLFLEPDSTDCSKYDSTNDIFFLWLIPYHMGLKGGAVESGVGVVGDSWRQTAKLQHKFAVMFFKPFVSIKLNKLDIPFSKLHECLEYF